MHIIAVTGTIGSGKSAVGEIAERAGAYVVDTDFLAKELQAEGNEGAKLIKAAFGAQYYEGGILNRKALAKEVFAHTESLQKLNGIMHPLIYGAMLKRLKDAEAAGFSLVCALVPLLFETGGEWIAPFHAVWLVTAGAETCVKRIVERDKCSAAEAKARISVQMPVSEKLSAAEKLSVPVTVIENDGGGTRLYKQVLKALKPYKKLLKSPK